MSTDYYERYWATRKGGKLSDFHYKWPFLLDHLPREQSIRIVDLGCGDGEVLGELQKLNPLAEYTGLDVSETALEAAADRFPGMTFHRITDGGRFPFEDGSVDLLLSTEVIEHVYDTPNVFAEISRSLKPDGKFLLTVPYHGLVKNILIAIFSFERHFDPQEGHVRFFTKKSLYRCLRTAGMEPVRCRYSGRFFPVFRTMLVVAEKHG